MPLLRYDLFRIVSNGGLCWLGPVKSIEHAQALVRTLQPSPNGFCVIDQNTGERIEVKPDRE